jgi:hypothetical protein
MCVFLKAFAPSSATSSFCARHVTYPPARRSLPNTSLPNWPSAIDKTSSRALGGSSTTVNCATSTDGGKVAERERMVQLEEVKSTAQKLGPKSPTVTAPDKFAREFTQLEALYGANEHGDLPKSCLVYPTLSLWKLREERETRIK